MKKQLLLVAIGALAASSLQAQIPGLTFDAKTLEMAREKLLPHAKKGFKIFQTFIKKPLIYGENTDVGVEVYNKEGYPIYVAVKSGDELVTKEGETVYTIESMKVLPLEGVDVMNKKTEFLIWKEAPADANQAPTWKYSVEPGKTVYVTFKEEKLRPQTGPGKGFAGKTDTLLSLKKNVKADDVVKA